MARLWSSAMDPSLSPKPSMPLRVRTRLAWWMTKGTCSVLSLAGAVTLIRADRSANLLVISIWLLWFVVVLFPFRPELFGWNLFDRGRLTAIRRRESLVRNSEGIQSLVDLFEPVRLGVVDDDPAGGHHDGLAQGS